MEEHRLHDRLARASFALQRNESDVIALDSMEKLDKQTAEIFIAGEKQCRKITNCDLPFSPPVAHWIHRKHAYQGLLSIFQNKCRNVGNTRRKARQAGLDTIILTEHDCIEGIKYCIHQLKLLRTQAVGLRKVHLRNCLIAAEDAKDKEKYKGILRVIEREEQRSQWRAIRRVTDDPRLGAITFVQRDTRYQQHQQGRNVRGDTKCYRATFCFSRKCTRDSQLSTTGGRFSGRHRIRPCTCNWLYAHSSRY